MKTTRRNILRFAAAGAGLMFLPSILRTARAEVRADAPAKRLLLLNLYGGVRASASFFASRQKKYNPYGLIENASGAKFPVGKLLDDHETGGTPLADVEYTLSASWKNARVPRFREMASEFSILGTWDVERGDHIRARLKEPTGSGAGDQAGILTRIAAALTKERGELDLLPFQLAPYAAFGQAGGLAQFTPVSLTSSKSLPTKSAAQAGLIRATGNDWAKDDAMRGRLDRAIIDARARNAKSMAEVYASHRKASRKIGARLAESWVNVESGEPDFMNAAFGNVNLDGAATPLTNAMLQELFKKTLGLAPSPYGEDDDVGAALGGPAESNRGVAMNAALAIRLFQLGAPAICLEIGGFDTHSQERETAPRLYRFLGRLWATLNWVMKRVPDPEVPGRSLFDTTLIMTMSDFGRDPGSTSSGFNGGEGSDHGSDPSCYYLPHAVMGGGTKPNRIISEVSPEDYRGDRAQEKFSQSDLLAMMLWSIGLPHDKGEWAIEDTSGAPLDVLVRG